jgi:hypothetical protein
MRKRWTVFAGALAMIIAATSQAAPVSTNYVVQLQVTFPGLAPMIVSSSGTTDVDDVTGAFTLSAGQLAFSGVSVFSPPQLVNPLLGGIFLTTVSASGNNLAGAFANGQGTLATGGSMPITGGASLHLFVPAFALALTQAFPFTGAFGVTPPTVVTHLLPFGVTAMVGGSGWQTGTVSAVSDTTFVTSIGGTSMGPTTVTRMGAAPTTTAGGSLKLNLVTATQITTSAPSNTAVFGALTIYLPEPGALLLLGSGLLGLVAIGTRKRS